jgi:hypothetical protein
VTKVPDLSANPSPPNTLAHIIDCIGQNRQVTLNITVGVIKLGLADIIKKKVPKETILLLESLHTRLLQAL